MHFLRVAFLLPVLFAVLKGLEYIMVNHLPKHYVFDAPSLQRIVKESLNSLEIDAPADKVMQTVHKNLKAEYPDHIGDFNSEDWVFNNAGNAMGSMIILHASISEYIIFFGTAVGTEGHTGTHFADDYFTILYGEQLAALPNATKAERYLPGDQHHLPYGVSKQYRMPTGSYALELAQGYIPTMLPFGLIEVLTSTFDFSSFAKTVKISTIHIVGNLLKGKF